MYHKKIAIVLLLMINCCLAQSNSSCCVDAITRFIRTESAQNNDYFHKLGDHFVAEFMDCHNKLDSLTTIEELEEVLRRAAQAAGATVLVIKGFAFPPHALGRNDQCCSITRITYFSAYLAAIWLCSY